MIVSELLKSAGYRAIHHNVKMGKVDVYRIDYPGKLSGEVRESLLNSLMPVAVSAFRQKETKELRRDVEQHIFEFEGLLIVADENGVPVAFRMWEFIELNFIAGTDILYLAGMCVHEDWQRQGIGEILLQYVLREDFRRSLPDAHAFGPLPLAPYVVLRTQNPIMKCCFDRAIGEESYPLSGSSEIPADIARVGQIVSRHLGDTHFDSDVMISRGLYGHSLYGTSPTSPSDKYASLFSQLDLTAGDSMVCVWRRPTH